MEKPLNKPRVFLDVDVLFAGAASPAEHGASLVILRMAEITLIEALTCEQVITEVERNLEDKMPRTLPAFRLLVSRCLQVVPNPLVAELKEFAGLAHPQDLPILVAAVKAGASCLATFNLRHFQPGVSSVTVLKPGDFVLRVRAILSGMSL